MSPFRDATPEIEREAAALEVQRLGELQAIPSGHRSIFVRRSARIGAGVIGCVGAALVAGAMFLDTGGYTLLMLWTWAAMIAAYLVTAVLASGYLARRLRRAATRRGEPYGDLAALKAVDLGAIERRLAAARGHASYALPLVAIALLAPHTLQLLAGLMMDPSMPLADYDEWMRWTSLLLIHVYGYAVIAAWRFPVSRRPGRLVLFSTGLSSVPWILYVLPPLVVLVTAVLVVVIAFRPMGRVIDAEEAKLCAVEA
jgi:hypothetical protein